ncbi:MAG: winged helix family transcriptional regulator [Pedobacter sp.]|nr:MAG: winged helix family transcriptional regulator [Pedobacter sp.]
MFIRPEFHLEKRKYFLVALILPMILLICAAFSTTDSQQFALERREVLLRRIGHELLLKSGDSISRVLPIKMIGGNEYHILFEHALTFQTESLVNIASRLLNKDPLTTDYVVKVINGENSDVVYSFAGSKARKDEIIACIGRKQPKARYEVSVQFKSSGIATVKNGYLLGSLPFLAFVGFIFLRSGKTKRPSVENQRNDLFHMGSVVFDANSKKLFINGISTDLTGTENRVLRVFALSPNEVIERSRLQKEIWEDEGVIVGRSLDMFISKLRKKLECDSNIKIIVIRGIGYKLSTSV